MLIDADAYFRSVREAMRNACHSIFILGWDIDTRTSLVPQGADDGFPDALGDFLSALVAARPELRIYVLNWDFAVLYALERESPASVKLMWNTQPRLQFHMDDRHPSGASHHQKVVVIDDAVAYVGGLDLTRCRWDTSAHACDEPLRHDADGKAYAPFHDVQAIVDAEVARALGELARSRWRRATGRDAVGPCSEAYDRWPHATAVDLTEIDVAIARTEPKFESEAGVFEVRQLHLDAIAAAKRFLFFENQYFTSSLIADALTKRLTEENGPEILVVSPHTQSGWLEEATMGVLRARLHRHLKAADKYDRYALACPHIGGLEDGCLNVHSKIFAVDDRLFGVGSANLSSRSMSLDTECHLVIEATGDDSQVSRISQAIATMRNRLLAEHLATVPQTVQHEIEQRGSLHQAVKVLAIHERTLQLLEPSLNAELDALIPDSHLIDPEEPIDSDYVVAQFLPQESRKNTPQRLKQLMLLALALVTLAIIWRWTPLRDWINLASLTGFARSLDQLPLTPVAVMVAYVAAGLLMIPVTLLIAVTGIVFGPMLGIIYALGGALLSASLGYGVGFWLGRDTVRRLLGERINRLSERIARQGILAMMLIRFLPIAPFMLVNIMAGASHIRFRDYLIGTGLGMLPGIVITVIFVDRLAEVVRHPTPSSILTLVIVALLLILLAVSLQRLIKRRESRQP